MKEYALSVEEFKRLIPRVKCINLFHYNLFNSSKLCEICTVISHEIESVEDMESLNDANLVWYAGRDGERVMWDAPGASNIVLGSLARNYTEEPSLMDEKLGRTVASLRQGLEKHVEIICVYDSTLGALVVVDGVYRGIALYYLYLTDPRAMENILSSRFRVRIVTLRSTAGALLFPCDFVNICRGKSLPD